ncbi:hypothetical protein GWK47_023818 [Chionoecetes opilio]|uniref:Uncharacterized protein n=1 Tax=Chionoecetes opilio TaxID=41210 RepID=A0A8J4XLH6_CHIOP|nr:hypothetical protein GWK47_023818 [Chionoecetes opilio]
MCILCGVWSEYDFYRLPWLLIYPWWGRGTPRALPVIAPRNGRPSHVDQPRCTTFITRGFRRDAARVTPNACDHVELFPALTRAPARASPAEKGRGTAASVCSAGLPRVPTCKPFSTTGEQRVKNFLWEIYSAADAKCLCDRP